MQDRYVGDVGDYGKYGLLRALCGTGAAALRLGVAWWRVPNESHNEDGKHVRYLERDRAGLKRCDPELYARLRALLKSGERELSRIPASGVLPPSTLYYADPISWPPLMRDSRSRRKHRLAWLGGALESLTDADLVFADPDNGLTATTSWTSAKAPKSMFVDEARAFMARGQSLVIYHHLGRNDSHQSQIEGWLGRLSDELSPPSPPFALWYHRGTARAFFVLPTAAHAELLRRRATDLLHREWGTRGHFEGVGIDGPSKVEPPPARPRGRPARRTCNEFKVRTVVAKDAPAVSRAAIIRLIAKLAIQRTLDDHLREGRVAPKPGGGYVVLDPELASDADRDAGPS